MYHKITAEVTHQIKCNKCGSTIYPAQWTDDIERIFNYYQKMAVPEKSAVRFTKLFYAVLLLLLFAVAGAAYLFMEGLIPF